MRRKLVWIEAVLLSLAAAWAAIGCLCTAFSLPITRTGEIAAGWAICCIGSIFLLSRRRGVFPALLITAAGIFLLWKTKSLEQQSLAVLSAFASVYDNGYHWGIPAFLHERTGPVDLPMALYGVFIIESIACTVCRRKGGWFATLLLIAPLAICLVVTDTVPEEKYLFTLLLCLALLLLTDSVRAESGDQGSRLAAAALIPTALALALLFHAVPQATYRNTTAPIRQRIIEYIQEIPQKIQAGDIPFANWIRAGERVDLAALGAQSQLGLPVAEITAAQEGTVYLRVKDYDKYTGIAWESTRNRTETLAGTGDAFGAVVVRELSSQGGRLLPSFPAGETILENGAANPDDEKVYQVERMSAVMAAYPGERWLSLPESTQQWAQELLKQIPGEMSGIDQAASSIADYVRSIAPYNRQTAPMPLGRTDFAQWFLTEAGNGYCVHFASAAAVLLRSAGIPARYVIGYKAEAIPGQTVRVTSNDAHAWVEYYNYRKWTWSILEVTPGELRPEPTEETTEEVTEAPTQTLPQPRPETSAPTAPPTMPPQASAPEAVKKLPLWPFVTVLCILLLSALLEGQRILRIRLRKRRQQTGNTNRRAATRWREVCVLSRLLGRNPPKELENLVEKAIFSQHELTREELGLFIAFGQFCRRKLKTHSRIRKLLYRYWYAVQ